MEKYFVNFAANFPCSDSGSSSFPVLLLLQGKIAAPGLQTCGAKKPSSISSVRRLRFPQLAVLCLAANCPQSSRRLQTQPSTASASASVVRALLRLLLLLLPSSADGACLAPAWPMAALEEDSRPPFVTTEKCTNCRGHAPRPTTCTRHNEQVPLSYSALHCNISSVSVCPAAVPPARKPFRSPPW